MILENFFGFFSKDDEEEEKEGVEEVVKEVDEDEEDEDEKEDEDKKEDEDDGWFFGLFKKKKEKGKERVKLSEEKDEVKQCLKTLIQNDSTILEFNGTDLTFDKSENIKPGKLTIIKVSDDIYDKCTEDGEHIFTVDMVCKKNESSDSFEFEEEVIEEPFQNMYLSRMVKDHWLIVLILLLIIYLKIKK